MPPGGVGAGQWRITERKRQLVLEKLQLGQTLNQAIEAAEWTKNAYHMQLRHHTAWASQCRAAIQMAHDQPKDWTRADGFAGFRKTFLGHDSPWFHLQAIDAINEMAPGSVLLILWPPLHGKTSLWEDYDIYRLCTDPSTRITVGSEKISQATKITRYVRDKLDHGAEGMAGLRARFGPFAPPKGVARGQAAAQSWSAGAFDVAKKPKGIDSQRDFSMQSLGMSSSIVGTRTDLLQVDDPQSVETLRKANNTEYLVERFRQDWLSRPAQKGRTVILMNRVGEGDFPEYLMEKTDLVDRVIKVPAWDPERGGWAWPEVHSHEDYTEMRKKVGEDAWARNYMQRATGGKNQTFTNELIGPNKNPMRSVVHAPPRPPSGSEANIVISIDPGFTKAGFHVGAMEPDMFRSLDLRLLENVKAYGSYAVVLEELIQQFHRPGLSVVSTVIFETKAFQRGLLNDEAILTLRARYGFDLRPFETGTNKYDPDLGIPQIARAMEHHEIEFPDADQVSADRYAPLYYQMRRWRPGIKGNRLEQDLVMALWFGFHHWKVKRRIVSTANARQFDWSV